MRVANLGAESAVCLSRCWQLGGLDGRFNIKTVGPRDAYSRSYALPFADERGFLLSPEKFEIVVRGRIGEPLAESLSDFEVSYCTDGHTHLVGVVPDQARIRGLFGLLLDSNFELVSVNPVREQ